MPQITWKVVHFLNASALETSPSFNHPSLNFKLGLIANRNLSYIPNREICAIFLICEPVLDRLEQVQIGYEISLVDGKGEKRNTQVGIGKYFGSSPVYGGQFNLDRNVLLDPENGFIIDGTLTITCEVEVIKVKPVALHISQLPIRSRIESINNTSTIIWPLKAFLTLTHESYLSPMFPSPGHVHDQFQLVLRPNRQLFHRTEPQVVVYLKRISYDQRDLLVWHRIAIVNSKNEKCEFQEGITRFDYLAIKWNNQCNMDRRYLSESKNGLLYSDGTLKLFVEIKILPPELYSRIPGPSNLPKILQNFQKLLESEAFADITLVVEGGKELRAHKAIITARSSVFSAMFEHVNTKESLENRVEIPDIRFEVMEQLLRYLYTEDVRNLNQLAPDLLAAADKYDLDCLKTRCELFLGSNLHISSVCRLYLLADAHNATHLKTTCLEFITANAAQIMETKDWKLILAHPELVTDLFKRMSQIKH